MFYADLFRKIINYQIYLVTLSINLFIISTVSTYQLLSRCSMFTNQLIFHNRIANELNYRLRRPLKSIRKRLKKARLFVLGHFKQGDDLGAALTDQHHERSNSVFYSNKQNDHQILLLLEKMDMCMKWVSFWPNAIQLLIKHVEKRLEIEAEYCSQVLNHCQQTRAQLNKDDSTVAFFNFVPIFMTTINQEFELTNEIIQNCEALLTNDFVEPLESKIQDFNTNLLIIKHKWNARVNSMQDLICELRKSQKIYLKCALHYIRLTHNEMQTDDESTKDANYLKREEIYRSLLQKATSEHKMKINEVNKCMVRLERFKNQCLNDIQHLIDDASAEVRRLIVNYVMKLYPNQKTQLLNQLIGIVPETQFRNFVTNLKIPNLPHYVFTRYDEIKC